MHRSFADTVVIGAGPAGLSFAAEMSVQGGSVVLVTEHDAVRWPNTYGVWTDELAHSAVAACVQRSWSDTEVVLSSGAVKAFGRGYALLDNAAAIRVSLAALRAGRGSVVHGTVATLHHDDLGTDVHLEDGRVIRASLVIDASGNGAFTERDGPAPSLFQTAVGWHVAGSHPWATDRMRLMDFSHEGVYAASEPASFLYAMPTDAGVFVEETFLIGPSRSSDLDVLRRRLVARLARDGVDVVDEGPVETVRIPMDVALPIQSQRVVPFGAAASMIHPATGYSVGRSFKTAGALAGVVVQAQAEGQCPHSVAQATLASLWSEDAVLAHQLLTFGGRFLSGLDARQTARFFEAFFKTPSATWAAYMQGDLSAAQLASVMLMIFKASPSSVRLRMMWSGAELQTLLSAVRSLTRTRRSA